MQVQPDVLIILDDARKLELSHPTQPALSALVSALMGGSLQSLPFVVQCRGSCLDMVNYGGVRLLKRTATFFDSIYELLHAA